MCQRGNCSFSNLKINLKSIQVDSIPKDTAEIETGIVEKYCPGKQTAKLGLVWRNREKISQIINSYLFFPLSLLIILCK
jgi:hypothetical protein